MTTRLPDAYFDAKYADSVDPWQLEARWYERRKYAITLALLPYPRYRHAFEPGCSIGVLTEHLTRRCRHAHEGGAPSIRASGSEPSRQAVDVPTSPSQAWHEWHKPPGGSVWGL